MQINPENKKTTKTKKITKKKQLNEKQQKSRIITKIKPHNANQEK